MKLFTNGCSWTWGAEIIENNTRFKPDHPDYNSYDNHQIREKKNFTYQLHKKLNTEEYCSRSFGGSSNKKIVRTTLEYFTSLMKENIKLDDFICVIQWTEISRYEIYDRSINDYVSMNVNGIYSHENSLMQDRYNKICQERYKLDEQNFIDEFKTHLMTLGLFFQQYNIKYVFCQLESVPLENFFYDQFNWLKQDLQTLLYVEGDFYKYFYPYKHPNILGHAKIAETLYNRLQELYNI